MANNAKFAIDLKKYIKVVGSQGNKEMRRAGVFALKGVMKKTPVDNGTARGNWNVGLNTIDRSTGSESSSKKKEALDPAKFNEGNAIIDGFKNGDTINISNSMPYINRLEFTDYSAQGSGMVRRTFEELKVFLRKRNRRV